MKRTKHVDPAIEEQRDDMRDAHRLLRKATYATLAISPVGFSARIVVTGQASLSDDLDAWLNGIAFAPKPMYASLPPFPAPLTIELKLKDAMNLSIGAGGEDDALTLSWDTPLGRMELALYDTDNDPGD
jgi:hypothetical protein